MKNRKKIYVLGLLALVLAGMTTACKSGIGGSSAAEERDSLARINKQQAVLLDGVNAILDDISLVLDSVMVSEGQILALGGSEFVNDRTKMKAKVRALGDLLERQRSRISDVEGRLAESKESASRFQRLVSLLKQQLDENSATIEDLEKKLDDANFDLASLRGEVDRQHQVITNQREVIAEQRDVIGAQDAMLNECYYLVGSKKELKDLGILTRGSLFKKSKADLGNIPQGLFRPVDIRRFRRLHLDGKKVKLISPAPQGSYSIDPADGGGFTLRIHDPSSFWSVSNYLVVQCD